MAEPEPNEFDPPTVREQVAEAVAWVNELMRSGKVNPDDVYPPGRYQGD